MLNTFLPDGAELKHTCLQHKALQPWILNLVEAVAVEDRHQRLMVCHKRELQTSEVDAALLHAPDGAETLEFDHHVSRFGICDEATAALS